MHAEVNGARIEIVIGDITNEETDAIVNAANMRLSGGGGVDGAIHRVGGPSILEECKKLNGCATGKAVITNAGNLKAKKVIHAVGPIYVKGKIHVKRNLESAYESSLKLALENNIESISFPSISTGTYGYPIAEASRLAMDAIVRFLKANQGIKLVRIVLFSQRDYGFYEDLLKRPL